MRERIREAVLVASLVALLPATVGQEVPLQVQAAVQSQSVFVGQQFLLQIQIRGSDDPDPVDIGALEAGFSVTEAGGGSSNSTSVSIVNGQMTRQVQRGYNLNYRLAARRAGQVRIPSLTVTANGRSARTQPISLTVQPPQENDDFKFRLSLSESRAYVGQALKLTAEWYIGREVQDFSFTMPLLDDRRFEIRDSPTDAELRTQAGNDLLEFRLGDRNAVARKQRGTLDGREYIVVRFEKLLIPRAAGSMTLPAATVTFSSPRSGQSRRRSLFDDFFGGGVFSGAFGGRPVMETLAIPSNRPSLAVLDLPSEGRPPAFNGWIGQFEIHAEAKPAAVAVGEPITLSLKVDGPGILAVSRLPPLDSQEALSRDFRVPREIGAGEKRGTAWHFTQTLRAKHDGVTEIPAVELPYFDPTVDAYRIARSEPIPVHVETARVVTADDAEGRGLDPRQLEIESTEQGIAHNYVDLDALEPMQDGLGSWLRALGPAPLVLALLMLPPLAYLGLLGIRLRRHYENAPRWRAGSALSHWRKSVRAIDVEAAGSEVAAAVLVAIREYLGVRLTGSRTAAAAWTAGDAEDRLRALVEGGEPNGHRSLAEPLNALKSVFERCEAGRYAGSGSLDTDWKRRLVVDAEAAVDGIEEGLP